MLWERLLDPEFVRCHVISDRGRTSASLRWSDKRQCCMASSTMTAEACRKSWPRSSIFALLSIRMCCDKRTNRSRSRIHRPCRGQTARTTSFSEPCPQPQVAVHTTPHTTVTPQRKWSGSASGTANLRTSKPLTQALWCPNALPRQLSKVRSQHQLIRVKHWLCVAFDIRLPNDWPVPTKLSVTTFTTNTTS